VLAVPVIGEVVPARIHEKLRHRLGAEVLELVVADEHHGVGLGSRQALADLRVRVADGRVASAIVLQRLGLRPRRVRREPPGLLRDVRLGTLAALVPGLGLLEGVGVRGGEGGDDGHAQS